MVAAALVASGASCASGPVSSNGPAASGSTATAIAARGPAGSPPPARTDSSSRPAAPDANDAGRAAPRPSAGCASPSATGTAAPAPGADTTGGPGLPGATGADGSEVRTLATPAGERTYRIARPTATTSPAPLVLLFHGFGGSAESFSALTRLPERGAAAGFVVVAPDGTGARKTWQFTGRGTDASFVDALVDEVARTSCIDLDRITATGFSAGAAFTIAYSCARQDRIHAIVTVAVDFQLGCTKPMSILAFHGTLDTMVPYENEAVGLSLPGVKVRGTDLNMGDWATLASCSPAPEVEDLGTEVRRSTWSGCTPGTEVVLDAIQGGAHAWPGADPARSIGLTTQQIDATTEALAFFQRDHRPVP